MAEITKPDYAQLWASGGAIIAPSPNKVQLGWTAEIPPHQWENWAQNRQDRAIGYIFQTGIPEWDASTEYFANKSFVQYQGVTYKALSSNVNTSPESSSAWQRWAMGDAGVATFTSSATFVVPAGKTQIFVTAVAGGGGGGKGGANVNNPGGLGGGGGGGGGAGQSVYMQAYSVTPGQTINITVGAGGAGATVADGGNGGNTVLSGVVTLTGGTGGGVGASQTNPNTSPGGQGGTGGASGAGFPAGGPGEDGSPTGMGGQGATSILGGGGSGGRASTTPVAATLGLPAAGYGAGGGGGGGIYGTGTNSGGNGGAGSPGFVMIYY